MIEQSTSFEIRSTVTSTEHAELIGIRLHTVW